MLKTTNWQVNKIYKENSVMWTELIQLELLCDVTHSTHVLSDCSILHCYDNVVLLTSIATVLRCNAAETSSLKDTSRI